MSTIGVAISYEGTEQGAAQIGRLQQNLTAASAAQQAATRTASDLGAATTTLGQQAGRVGTAFGAAGQVLARLSPEMRGAAGLITQMGGATTALTGAMGPLGVVLAAVSVATGIYATAQERARAEAEATRDTIERLSASYETLRGRIMAAAGARARDAQLARGEGTREDFEAQAQVFENRARQLDLMIRNIGRNDDLSREERSAQTRMRVAQRGAAMRQAAAAREHLAGGAFVTDVESGFTGEGSGVAIAQPSRRGGGRGAREQTFAQMEAAAWREAEERRAIYESALEEGLAQERALIDQKEDVARQLHENAMERQQIERDGIAAHYAFIREREQEALDKAKESSRERMRSNQSLGQEAGSIAKTIGSAYFDAFQVAIEGTMSLEDALLAATKQILKSIGEELVARGIGKILEGIAEIPSPTAATKIGGGTAMLAFGIGLGAAGAAIPSPSGGGAESPREQPDDSDAGPRGDTTIVFGNPVLTAGTQAQLARGLSRVAKGGRSFPATVGR